MKSFTLFFLLFCSYVAYSQSQPFEYADSVSVDSTYFEDDEVEKEFDGATDSTQITTRYFSETEVTELKKDSDLNYKQPPTVIESVWDRFKKWLAWFFESLFSESITSDIGRILIYTGVAVLLIVIIMKLLKVNAFKVFYSGADQGKQDYKVFDENIHEMDFDTLIKEAVEKSEYRIATRLIFLHSLKLLSDKHLIDFNPGKTNHDYVEELKSPELKTGLNELSFYFDYAWYGNFSITHTQFQSIQNTFSNWRAKMN